MSAKSKRKFLMYLIRTNGESLDSDAYYIRALLLYYEQNDRKTAKC